MSARERIMTIRLIEKLQEHPAWAKTLGIEVTDLHLSDAVEKEK